MNVNPEIITTDEPYTKNNNLKVENKQNTDDSLLNTNFVEPDSEITKVSYKDLMENI